MHIIHSFGRLTTCSFFRRAFSDFPKGCGWETFVEKARCTREGQLLDTVEECKMCLPLPDKYIETPDEVTDLTPINGPPCDAYYDNTAIIQKRTKNAMQSGTANTHAYLLTFMTDITWENPLMGWCSGSNSLNCIEMPFPSLESAKCYAERNGWETYVPKEMPKKRMPKKDYGAAFSWNKRTRLSTK